MSIQEIAATLYRCRCELADCPGRGRSWDALNIPERCRWCGRWTWNGRKRKGRPARLPTPLRQMTADERRAYNRKAVARHRAEKKAALIADQNRSARSKPPAPAIKLPKLKKQRSGIGDQGSETGEEFGLFTEN